MQRNIVKMTENVEGETLIYKTKFNNLEKSLKDLTAGGLFEQIEALLQEVKRLTLLTEKYEVRYFLLSLEIERRGKIIQDYVVEIESYRDTLLRKDREHIRELEKIKEEELYKIKKALESEIEALKNGFGAERTKFERRIQELLVDGSRKDAEINDLKTKLTSLLESNTKLKIDNEDLMTALKQAEARREYEVGRMRGEQQSIQKDIESKFKNEIENLKRQLAEEKQKEVEKNSRQVTEYFNDLLRMKDQEITKLKGQADQSSFKNKELEAEINSLAGIVNAKNRENAEIRDQINHLKASFDEAMAQRESFFQSEMQRLFADKEREKSDRLAAEVEKYEKEAQQKKAKIQGLESRLAAVENELGAERRRGEEYRDHLEQANKQLGSAQHALREEMRVVEESLTVQVEEKDNEIMKLLLQIRELHDMYNNKLSLETARGDNLATENELFKKEIFNLKELSEVRNKEIEEWRLKYRGYVTGDEAVNMREEVNRLRKNNMHLEDINTKLKFDLAKTSEKIKATEAEVETRNQEIHSLNDLASRRREEVLSVQQENDKLRAKIRSMTDQKDNVDAQKLINEEHFIKLQREIQQLKEQRDLYKDDYEKSQIQLALVNQKYAENLREQEEQMKKCKNPMMTSTTVKTSQIITKTTVPEVRVQNN
jgi:chromosome segregation ATPase